MNRLFSESTPEIQNPCHGFVMLNLHNHYEVSVGDTC